MKPEYPRPPKIAYWLLKFFCRKDYCDEVAGDLQEVYEWRLANSNRRVAQYRYFLDAFSAIRFYRGGRVTSFLSKALIFSFIKSAFRNFKRHAGYTALNVFGLAVSLSAALFILEYVSEELSYNHSSQADQLYRVSNDYYRFGGMIYESSMTFSGVGPAMQQAFPEVTEFARLYSPTLSRGGSVVLTRPDAPQINFKEHQLFFADPAYPEFFDLDITHGSNALNKPNTLMITAALAEKYFGSINSAIGQLLQYDDGQMSHGLIVKGIFEKPSFPLQVDADILVSYPTLEMYNPERFVNDWGGNAFITFVKVTENTNPVQIEESMSELTLRYKPGYLEKNEQGEYLRVNRYFLVGVTDIHLHSTYQNEVGPMGDATTIEVLKIIAIFIVIIAWINFINLSTAKSVDRAREVGVRKVMGARRLELVMQFFTEAVLISSMAILIALTLVFFGQSLFNQFVEKTLLLDSIDLQRFGLPALLIFLTGTILSGFYPALILSAHQSINALKGKSKVSSGHFLRRGLIAFQLLFSSLLIIATLAINQQLAFMNDQDMGFDMDEVLIMKGPVISESQGRDKIPKIELFKQQVMSIPGVSQVGTSTVIPGQGILRGIAISRIKESEADMKSIERVVISNGFLSAMDVTFIAGQDFNASMKGYEPIILNTSAAKALGFDDPKASLGQTLFEFTREERKVVGVIQDYHHESLNRSIDPMYFVRHAAFDSFYAIRLNRDQVSTTLAKIEQQYLTSYPGNPTEYYFLDRFFAKQYKKDEVNRKVFSAFALMAIIVSCLGLYGLSSYSALQRTKEVGVRKVLGASISGLFMLLLKEIFLLVVLGFVMAIPIAWVGIDSWLSEFAYRMQVGPLLFLLPLLLITAITLAATGSRILKVTLANPVQSLRYE
ncbi:MAG: FtsX-like permease family protein [Cytophagales bacterium]|nr:FtsX-like permease family protein [Cytophagales bacterium]